MTTKSLKEQVRVYERMLLLQALQVYPTRRAMAAGLHISLRTLFYKLRLHGLQHYGTLDDLFGTRKSAHRQKFDTCVASKSGASCGVP